jgi:hypothetical protein
MACDTMLQIERSERSAGGALPLWLQGDRGQMLAAPGEFVVEASRAGSAMVEISDPEHLPHKGGST